MAGEKAEKPRSGRVPAAEVCKQKAKRLALGASGTRQAMAGNLEAATTPIYTSSFVLLSNHERQRVADRDQTSRRAIDLLGSYHA